MTDAKLYRVLHDSPNDEMTSATFRETLQAHVLLWGNGLCGDHPRRGGEGGRPLADRALARERLP